MTSMTVFYLEHLDGFAYLAVSPLRSYLERSGRSAAPIWQRPAASGRLSGAWAPLRGVPYLVSPRRSAALIW